MYWQTCPNASQSGARFSGDGSPFGDNGGAPFRSPQHRPRYQSSPRYNTQYGSPFPDVFRHGHPGAPRPQRSPHYLKSPPHDFNYPSPVHGNMNSPHQGNRRLSNQMSDNRRGRGTPRYSSNSREFSSPGSNYSDSNPGGSDDIRVYYHPDMVQDPWAHLKSRTSLQIH